MLYLLSKKSTINYHRHAVRLTRQKKRLTEAKNGRVPKRFFGIRDFKAKAGQDSGLKVGHLAALLTLKANGFDTLTVKQWEVMINNDVLLF